MIWTLAYSGIFLISAASSNPSISGMLASVIDQAEWPVLGQAAAQQLQGRPALSDRVGFNPQWVSISRRMRRLVALSSTTRTRQFGHVLVPRPGLDLLAELGLQGQLDDEMEDAALVQFALHPDAPAHQLDELGGDGQPEARPAVHPGRRAVRLGEGIEDQLSLSGGMPMPVSRTWKWRRTLLLDPLLQGKRDDDFALGVNLMALLSRLVRIWRKRPGSP